MIENLFDSLNLFLMHHPHLLRVMHMLFWIKYWLLLGLAAVFVYLVYSDGNQKLPIKRSGKTASESVFIA